MVSRYLKIVIILDIVIIMDKFWKKIEQKNWTKSAIKLYNESPTLLDLIN